MLIIILCLLAGSRYGNLDLISVGPRAEPQAQFDYDRDGDVDTADMLAKIRAAKIKSDRGVL